MVSFRLAIRGLTFRMRQTVLSMVGVMLGVLALTTILSVSNGFQRDLIKNILETTCHIQVMSMKEHEVGEYQKVTEAILKVPGVTSVAPACLVQGMIENPEAHALSGTNIKGIVPEKELTVNSVGHEMVAGEFRFTGKHEVILGAELAEQLEARIGQTLKLTVLDGKHELRLVGVFRTGVRDFDFQMIFVPLELTQDTFGFENTVSHLFVKTDDPMSARATAAKIHEVSGYDARAWLDSNRVLLDAISLERRVMFVVIFLTLIVAAFGISNVLTMMVMEKYRDIGILRAMGMKPGQVVSIFLYQGMIIGILGTVLGCLGGWLAGVTLQTFPLRLPLDVYSVDYVPVAFKASDFASIALLAFGVSLLASYLPARRALAVDPAQAIRFYA